MKIHFSKAFTIIEVLVAAAVLTVVTLGAVAGITQLFHVQRSGNQNVSGQEIVAMIIEGVKADSAIYQKNLTGVDISQVNQIQLPLGYIDGLNLIPRESCPSQGCQMYVGYVITPMPNMPGLFQGTVRVYTPSTNASVESDNLYKFLTTAK